MKFQELPHNLQIRCLITMLAGAIDSLTEGVPEDIQKEVLVQILATAGITIEEFQSMINDYTKEEDIAFSTFMLIHYKE
ncbi:hypothetical protein fHeYen902_207 [Yersinia phage fHe-Yen9-02]|nr:hypothetical protein fHeYen902_207 [Yersinia phage fHe-Yen9-02]